MNHKNQKPGKSLKTGGALLAASLLAIHRVSAAPVIVGPPPLDTTPPAAQEDVLNNPMTVFLPSGVLGFFNPGEEEPFQFGSVIFRPHVSYGASYASGILAGLGSSQDTIIQQLSPGLTIDLGRHWSVDYTLGMAFYSSKELKDTLSHAASLNGHFGYGNWRFDLAQGYSYSDSPLTETATQTSQQAYSTSLGANYAFSDKMSADMGVNQGISLVENFQDSYTWSTMEWLNYAFVPRLNVGLGTGAGYTTLRDVSGSGVNNPDSIYEQLQARLNWRATDKISFQISAGGEDLQFLAAGYSDSLNPIFSAAIQYQPFKFTQISLSASRTVGTSDYYIIAQSTENTTVSLGLSQRLFGNYNLSLGVNYTKSDFAVALTGLGGTSRTDDIYTFNASFGRNFLKRGNWAITYQYLDDTSNVAGFSQRGNQVGFQIGYTY